MKLVRQSTESFCLKCVSENTQKTYRRVLREFFLFVQVDSPKNVVPHDVIRWRDHLKGRKQKPATINLKLSIVRSLYDFLIATGEAERNPASTQVVKPFVVSDELKGRVLESDQVRRLLAAPHKDTAEGMRDYCLMLVMLRMALRVAEVTSITQNAIRFQNRAWVIVLKVKGGRERMLPLPADVKREIDRYLQLDRIRRRHQHTDGETAPLFQPLSNYRTLEFNKALTPRRVQDIVKKWAAYAGLGKLTPHDLRRTAITKALDQGIAIRDVQMMSGHRDPKTVMRYDHHREMLERNPIHILTYD